MAAAWFGLAVFMAVACIRGLRFRRGVDRSYLTWYRNVSSPAVYRHLPLIAPYFCGYVFALMLVAAVRVTFAPTQASVVLDLLWGTLAAACFMLAFALSIFRMYAPPPWLTPKWLTDDDRKVGYERPRPDWADHGWLIIAFGFATMAVVTIVYVASTVATRAAG